MYADEKRVRHEPRLAPVSASTNGLQTIQVVAEGRTMNVETKYAKVGDANIAYQVVGQGAIDFVYVPCWLSHLDRVWREPRFARFIERLASFGRVILFDKRGTGLSDPMSSAKRPTFE